MHNRRKIMFLFLSGVIFFIVIVFSIAIGSVNIPIMEVFNAFTNHSSTVNRDIIVNVRLPRILTAVLVGSSLAVSGVLLQTVMRNPLADPGITGVSSGASLAAIAIMIFAPTHYYLIPLAAFIGGLFACGLVYALAWKNGIKPVRIILAGVAINAVLGGGTSLISILNSEKIQGILLWSNGSLAEKTWRDFNILLPYTALGLLLSVFLVRNANILRLGDKAAANLGVNVNKMRIIISAVAVFLASISTAVVGVIGFVGLIVPHICRLIIGSDHKYMLPFSVIVGAIVLLFADTLARTVANPIELPVGILMAVFGGPFFLYLLRKGEKR